MLTIAKKLSIGVAALSLVACGGGGGGGGGGSGTVGGGGVVYFPTEAEISQDFEDAMWYDLGYDVELVKTYTLQDDIFDDFVVVYDWDLGTYDAYDLTNYDIGENIGNYLDSNEWKFYYDLIPVGGNVYEDPVTGILFEKTQGTAKDRLKLAAAKEHLDIKAAAENLQTNYGLSAERAQEVGKLAFTLKSTPKERMTTADYDRFSTAIAGSTLGQMKSATEKLLKGDKSEMNVLIEKAAQVNGITVEDANVIVENIMTGNIQ